MTSIKKFHSFCCYKLFILEAFIFLCLIALSQSLLIGNFPYLKQLNNKKYILISSKGSTFLDPTLTKSSGDIIFGEEIYDYSSSATSTSAVQFSKEDGNLILALVVDRLLIFDQNETLLFNQTLIMNYTDSINYQKPYYFIPYKRNGNIFTTIFYHLNDYSANNITLYFQMINYDCINNSISFTEQVAYDLEPMTRETARANPSGSVGCVLLQKNNTNVINCVHGTFNYVQIINFYPDNNFRNDEPLIRNATKLNVRFLFKSIALPGREKAIHCSFSFKNFECIKYDVISNTYTMFQNFSIKLDYVYEPGSKAIFFEESGEVLFTLLGAEKATRADYLLLFICDLEGKCKTENYTTFGGMNFADLNLGINLVIPLDKLTYYFYTYSADIETYYINTGFEFNLTCKKYYNYQKTSCLEEIPEGFYCNSTEDKTLDKCHENCKSCVEGPTGDNNNCLKCKDNDTIYYDLGNCRNECPNGFFVDDEYNLTCKCTNNIECFYCDKNDLCTKCNTEKGYYPKNDEDNNTEYINCYKEPEGYYLLNEKYYPCYSTCNNCTEEGNDVDNKCTQCKEGYEFKSDFENDHNCYNICEFYYYFDENKNYHCTETENCPTEFNKLIAEQKKCIKNDEITPTFEENNITECTIEEYIKNGCNLTTTISIQDIINSLRNSIINNDNKDLLSNINNNINIMTKKFENITFQIIPLDNQTINSNYNNSILDLGECESILKKIYGLENSSIILFKIDIQLQGYSTMDVEYELYHPYNYSKLNLEYCKQETVDIHVPAFIDENEIYKYDPKSDYYNDLCFPYTNENGSDVTILDRKNEFVNNNLSLCDDDCEFKGYDSDNKKAICKCKIKYYIEELSNIDDIDSERFFKGWINIKNLINIKVIKCIKILGTKDGFLKNIGNFVLLSILILFIISAFYFYFKGFPKLKSEIDTLKNNIISDLNNENKKEGEENTNNKGLEINEKEKKMSVINIDDKLKKVNKPKRRKSKIKNKKKRNTQLIESKKKLNIINIKFENKNNIKFNDQNSLDKVINNNNEIKTKLENASKKLNDYELNSLDYKDAIELDKRTYLQYYWSLIKTKQLIVFTFYFNKDYNSYIIKIELFLFAFALYLTVSALFFTDNTIHQIYEDAGIFNFIYNIPQIIYSTIISAVINIIVKSLSLSESKILELKKEKTEIKLNNKISEVIKSLKLKFILFYIISSIFLVFFLIYLSCFCAVYRNTQYHLIKNTLLSFALSLLYPFALNLIPIFIRIPAIKSKNNECMYKISKIAQLV